MLVFYFLGKVVLVGRRYLENQVITLSFLRVFELGCYHVQFLNIVLCVWLIRITNLIRKHPGRFLRLFFAGGQIFPGGLWPVFPGG